MPSPYRLNEDDEFEFDEDQIVYNGVPFTGILYAEYPNAQLKRESPFRDGFAEGRCREWFPNGQLKQEWFAVHGRATGKFLQWHENGQPRSVGNYEYGVELSYDEWNERGDLVAHREINTTSELFKYVEHMRVKAATPK